MKFIFSIFTFLFLLSGCTVVGAGAVAAIGGTYYVTGEVQSSYDTSIRRLYDATLYSFKVDEIEIVSVKNSKTDADIEAKLYDDTEVNVHIFYNKEGYATLGVRVGMIADEAKSRELLKGIERYI